MTVLEESIGSGGEGHGSDFRLIPGIGLQFVKTVVLCAEQHFLAVVCHHPDVVAPVSLSLWLWIVIVGICPIRRQDACHACRFLTQPDAAAAVYEDVVQIAVAHDSPGRCGGVVLQIVFFKVIDEQAVTIAGNVIQAVRAFPDIVAAETLCCRLYAFHQPENAHVSFGREDPERTSAVAHEIIVIVAQALHDGSPEHMILFRDGRHFVIG